MTVQVRRPADKRFAKVLVFAPAGHGKTHLLGTAQEDERTSPMLMLDFEGGDETLAGLDIDVVEIRGWDDYNEVYEVLTSGEHWKLPGSSLKEGEHYRSLGIDSASETHIWALLTRIAEQGPRRKEPDLVELGDYNVASTQLRRLLREFRDLPLHVFYTAGSKETDERGVGKVKIPMMAGQMAEEVVHLMSIVGYLALSQNEEGETERVLVLQNIPGFRSKVRAPWRETAPDEIVDPTVSKLLDELQFKVATADWNGQPARRRGRRTEEPDPEPEQPAENGDQPEAEQEPKPEREESRPQRRRAGRSRVS